MMMTRAFSLYNGVDWCYNNNKQQAIKASKVLAHARTDGSKIPLAPIFYPTEEEFEDPIAYVRSIQSKAEQYGICKIVPPEGYTPNFNRRCCFGERGGAIETKHQNINRLQQGEGFASGKTYADLEKYKEMADEFEKNYKESHPETFKDTKDEDDLIRRTEDEYWRIVETNPDEAKGECRTLIQTKHVNTKGEVLVEYGSDVDARRCESGFAAGISGDPEDTEKHSWDMFELSKHPDNLLRFVDDDIPGLTTPWVYCGMLFATFCWHVEDHYLASVNYAHKGSAKTWYGIPGTDAEKFEDIARTTVPSLFKENPDKLYHITMVVPPGQLIENDVKVVKLVQKPGDFVVTFPRAYHSGFSHGFNVGEAVNFAPVDWIDMGRVACRNYVKGNGKRNAVFAHDRVVVTAAKALKNIFETTTARGKWMAHMSRVLRTDLETLADELENWQSILNGKQRGDGFIKGDPLRFYKSEHIPEVDGPGDCCVVCKAMPFAAVVRCECEFGRSFARCLQHWNRGCDCKQRHRKVEMRIEAEEVRALAKSLEL